MQKDERPSVSIAGPPGLAVFLRNLDSDRQAETEIELPERKLIRSQYNRNSRRPGGWNERYDGIRDERGIYLHRQVLQNA